MGSITRRHPPEEGFSSWGIVKYPRRTKTLGRSGLRYIEGVTGWSLGKAGTAVGQWIL